MLSENFWDKMIDFHSTLCKCIRRIEKEKQLRGIIVVVIEWLTIRNRNEKKLRRNNHNYNNNNIVLH